VFFLKTKQSKTKKRQDILAFQPYFDE